MKDQSGARKKGCAGYAHIVKNRDYLKTAETDIRNLHKTESEQMFTKYGELMIEAWIKNGESTLAATFKKTYIDDVEFSRYRYNVIGIPGNPSSTNSLERKHLDWKGTKSLVGLINWGATVNDVLQQEFVKLVQVLSTRADTLVKSYQIDDVNAQNASQYLSKHSALKTKCELIERKDVYPDDKQGFYFNNVQYHRMGKVTPSRIDGRHEALSGVHKKGETRQEYFERANGIAYVCRQAGVDQQTRWMCTCINFYKTTICPHVFIVKTEMGKDIETACMTKLSDISRNRKKKKRGQTTHPVTDGFGPNRKACYDK